MQVSAAQYHGQHGQISIVSDIPAGISVDVATMQADLDRFSGSYASGVLSPSIWRAQVLSGVSGAHTNGSAVTIELSKPGAHTVKELLDKDVAPRQEEINFADVFSSPVPRLGEPDLGAHIISDACPLAELATNAITAKAPARIAAAALAREYLSCFGVEIYSCTTGLGQCIYDEPLDDILLSSLDPLQIEGSAWRFPNPSFEAKLEAEYKRLCASQERISLVVTLIVKGLPAGLGDWAEPDALLSQRVARAAFSLPNCVNLSFGAWAASYLAHYQVDPVLASVTGFERSSNFAGGIEAGISTGKSLFAHVNLLAPAPASADAASLDLMTLEPAKAPAENWPIGRLLSQAVWLEAECALELAQCYQNRFGGKSMSDAKAAYKAYLKRLDILAH